MSEVFPLGEVVRPNRPRVKPESMPDAPFIGMEHVEAHTMKLLGSVPAATMKARLSISNRVMFCMADCVLI